MEIEIKGSLYKTLKISDSPDSKAYAVVQFSTKVKGAETIEVSKADLIAAVHAICRKQ